MRHARDARLEAGWVQDMIGRASFRRVTEWAAPPPAPRAAGAGRWQNDGEKISTSFFVSRVTGHAYSYFLPEVREFIIEDTRPKNKADGTRETEKRTLFFVSRVTGHAYSFLPEVREFIKDTRPKNKHDTGWAEGAPPYS